jgi:hypothetical protein
MARRSSRSRTAPQQPDARTTSSRVLPEDVGPSLAQANLLIEHPQPATPPLRWRAAWNRALAGVTH